VAASVLGGVLLAGLAGLRFATTLRLLGSSSSRSLVVALARGVLGLAGLVELVVLLLELRLDERLGVRLADLVVVVVMVMKVVNVMNFADLDRHWNEW